MYLTQGLRRAAQIRPRARAITEGDRHWSWADVLDRTARTAGLLRALGLEPGDRVAILSLNNASYFTLLFAVPWVGGVVVPLNTRLIAAEIDFILEDSGARFLFVDKTFAPLLASLKATGRMQAVIQFDAEQRSAISRTCDLLPFEPLMQSSAPAEDGLYGGDDLAGIYYTGGTTGRSKGVMLSHGNLVANATNVMICLGYDRDTIYLHAPPMFHLADGCSTFGVTMQGGAHVFMPRFDALQFLELVQRERVTDVTLVPTMIGMILNHPRFAAFDLSSFRRIYFGAAPMPDGLLRRMITTWPAIKLQQAWGMTELSPIATTMDPRFSVLDGPNAGRLRSCGQAVPMAELRIADADGNEVPRGEVGEVIVRGPTVMKGYWNQPEATAAALRGGWMHSGDAGVMDDEGFVYIVDRLKDMIVTGGENVYSAEVENAISLMAEVAEVAVIGIPDEVWGEAVHAVVVPRADHVLSAEAVIAHCRHHVAGYKAPRSVEIRTTALPLSAAGKILKTELRAPFWRDKDRGVH